MDKTPDDLLRHIFEVYVHDFGFLPANILTVSRRWHALLLATRNLWARVNIHVDSYHTIPYIIGRPHMTHEHNPFKRNEDKDYPKYYGSDARLDSKGPTSLLAYLQRSNPYKSRNGLPLDISIKWGALVDIRPHYLKEGHRQWQYHGPSQRRCDNQSEELLRYLAGFQDDKEGEDDEQRSRLDEFVGRWSSVKIDMSSISRLRETRPTCSRCSRAFEPYSPRMVERIQ